MQDKELSQTIRKGNKLVAALEDQSLELCELSNRLIEYTEFLEQELNKLKESTDEQN